MDCRLAQMWVRLGIVVGLVVLFCGGIRGEKSNPKSVDSGELGAVMNGSGSNLDSSKSCIERIGKLEEALRLESALRVKQQRELQRVLHQGDLLHQTAKNIQDAGLAPGAERILQDFVASFGAIVSREQSFENELDKNLQTIEASHHEYHGLLKSLSHLSLIIPILTVGYLLARLISVSPAILLILVHSNNLLILGVLFVSFLITKQEPLQSLVSTHPDVAIAFQLIIAGELPVIFGLIWLNLILTRGFIVRLSYAVQLILVSFVGLDYRWRIWLPIMYRRPIQSGLVISYSVYLLITILLLVLSIFAYNPSHAVFETIRDMFTGESSSELFKTDKKSSKRR